MVNYWPSHEDGRPGAIGARPSFVNGVHDQSTSGGVAKINPGTGPKASLRVKTDERMPVSPIDGCSSPGARQGDDAPTPMSPFPMLSYASPPRSTARKRITALEAYNTGMLFQYMIDCVSDLQNCCNRDSTVDYEKKWVGHQPLTPNTWAADGDDTASIVSTSELRLNRRRRRRGVLSPKLGAKIGIDSRTISEDGSHDFVPSIPFPGDVVDPHMSPKKKWHPQLQ